MCGAPRRGSSRRYLGCTSAVPRLPLGCLSAASRLHLGCISAPLSLSLMQGARRRRRRPPGGDGGGDGGGVLPVVLAGRDWVCAGRGAAGRVWVLGGGSVCVCGCWRLDRRCEQRLFTPLAANRRLSGGSTSSALHHAAWCCGRCASASTDERGVALLCFRRARPRGDRGAVPAGEMSRDEPRSASRSTRCCK